jgi:hypothetical protein
MSRRGLVAALLCGLIGLGLGAVVAYAVEPATTNGGTPQPVAAVSPSLPVDVPTPQHYHRDIPYPPLEPGLPLDFPHTISNDLAHWAYHVPQGWQAYWVCSVTCPPGRYLDLPMAEKEINKADEIRFRPPDEPVSGGYSLRVRILDNTFVDVHQTVATKIVGFRDSSEVADFNVIHRTQRSVYFDYRDKASDYHRFNFFQWFAVPGQTNATLEMSVSGRKVDVPGLKALFDRFADNVVGTPAPTQGGKGGKSGRSPKP